MEVASREECSLKIPRNRVPWTTMPFASIGLSVELESRLRGFADTSDFVQLYKAYNWGNDTYERGFPDILRVEARVSGSGKAAGISIEDIREVVHWGKMRNPKQIRGAAESGLKKSDILVNGPAQTLRWPYFHTRSWRM